MQSSEPLGPSDLAKVREIFEMLCSTQHIAHRSAAADQLAKRILQLYRTGVRDNAVFMTLGCIQKKGPRDRYLRGSKPH